METASGSGLLTPNKVDIGIGSGVVKERVRQIENRDFFPDSYDNGNSSDLQLKAPKTPIRVITPAGVITASSSFSKINDTLISKENDIRDHSPTPTPINKNLNEESKIRMLNSTSPTPESIDTQNEIDNSSGDIKKPNSNKKRRSRREKTKKLRKSDNNIENSSDYIDTIDDIKPNDNKNIHEFIENTNNNDKPNEREKRKRGRRTNKFKSPEIGVNNNELIDVTIKSEGKTRRRSRSKKSKKTDDTTHVEDTSNEDNAQEDITHDEDTLKIEDAIMEEDTTQADDNADIDSKLKQKRKKSKRQAKRERKEKRELEKESNGLKNDKIPHNDEDDNEDDDESNDDNLINNQVVNHFLQNDLNESIEPSESKKEDPVKQKMNRKKKDDVEIDDETLRLREERRREKIRFKKEERKKPKEVRERERIERKEHIRKANEQRREYKQAREIREKERKEIRDFRKKKSTELDLSNFTSINIQNEDKEKFNYRHEIIKSEKELQEEAELSLLDDIINKTNNLSINTNIKLSTDSKINISGNNKINNKEIDLSKSNFNFTKSQPVNLIDISEIEF
ncbi:hypothetical protein B5S31_g3954 [[Candida] boidinii]|nr:hypothetical protein B5S31_g3954 [[Candida] boidinii]